MILVGLVGGYIIGLVGEDRREGYVYIRRKGVVKLVINGRERLSSN
jgi:hypothetical protein